MICVPICSSMANRPAQIGHRNPTFTLCLKIADKNNHPMQLLFSMKRFSENEYSMLRIASACTITQRVILTQLIFLKVQKIICIFLFLTSFVW